MDWNAEWKKAEVLVCVVSYIIEYEEFNPGSVYIVKDINQKFIEYLSELGILEQPNTTKFTDKLLLALPNISSTIICKKSVVLFSDTESTLVKDYIESQDHFLLHYKRLYLVYEENFLSRRTVFQMN